MKKEVKYEREFTSRKNNKSIEKTHSKEEILFMKEFKEKFGNSDNLGFDGTLMYLYKIDSTLRIPDYMEKSMPYKLIFTINIFGAPNKFHHSSDLEFFLRDRGFKKIVD